MRAWMSRACVPAVLLSAVVLTGCSSDPLATRPKPDASAPPAAGKDASSKKVSSAGPVLAVGETGEFDTGELSEDGSTYRVTSKMSVKVLGAEYVTPDEIDADGGPENGQFVKLRLTLKNIGDVPAMVMTYGVMEWQDTGTAAQDASLSEGFGDGRALDATYRPGQSATGYLVLDVGRKGGTVSYNGSQDPDAEGPLFSVTLPEA
jgi:PBP1b-binding outer membrane lipoprotein LpoB